MSQSVSRSQPTVPRRRHMRLSDYDYSRQGAYFITVCTHDHKPLLGEVVDGTMQPNALGRIVEEEWHRTADVRPSVTLDAFVVMPNHFHGILFITEDLVLEKLVGITGRLVSPSHTVGSIVRGLKAVTTSRIRKLPGMERQRVWQRNYYDHVIRSDRALERIREYILGNPMSWKEDRFYQLSANDDAGGGHHSVREGRIGYPLGDAPTDSGEYLEVL